jgi:hypothetical protein
MGPDTQLDYARQKGIQMDLSYPEYPHSDHLAGVSVEPGKPYPKQPRIFFDLLALVVRQPCNLISSLL